MTEWTKTCGMRRAALALTICVTSVGSAQARQPACADREAVVSRLADNYGESRQAIGLGANNGVVEVFASGETGTWTITVTMPTGVTCLVASGQAFEAVAEELTADADNDA